MRDAAKDLCDMVGNSFVADTTWTRWLNDGIEGLYRIAVKRNVGAFQTKTASPYIVLTSASNQIAKPATFRRLIGVTMDPGSASLRRSLPKLQMGERDSGGLLGPRAYHVVGQNIEIEPFQICAGTYQLHFVAGPTILAADVDLIDTVLEPFDEYATTWAAIRALGKEESDNRGLYKDLEASATDIDEFFAILDGDDPSTIVDADETGPSYWSQP
jgi:hypothetical protein